MYRVFGMSASGNCYKVKLVLEQTNAPYQWQEVDILNNETHSAEFLAMNPCGKVPTLEIEAGRYLAESNAILYYLSRDTPLWPKDEFDRAKVLQWLFFEQYSHEPFIAVACFIRRFLAPDHARRAELPRLLERGYQALDIMEQHLCSRRWFVAETYSIADIALYAYTHIAETGGFELKAYPAIQSWMARIQQQPAYAAMTKSGA